MPLVEPVMTTRCGALGTRHRRTRPYLLSQSQQRRRVAGLSRCETRWFVRVRLQRVTRVLLQTERTTRLAEWHRQLDTMQRGQCRLSAVAAAHLFRLANRRPSAAPTLGGIQGGVLAMSAYTNEPHENMAMCIGGA